MENRGRKKSNYVEFLSTIIKSEYKDIFFNGEIIIPNRNERIYETLVTKLKEKNYNLTKVAVYQCINRYINDWFLTSHDQNYIDENDERYIHIYV